MRSSWKLLLTHPDSNIEFTNKIKDTFRISVNPYLVNKRINVYNGKKYESLIIRDYMSGKHFSNFVSSKYNGKGIHVKKKKRNKK